MKASKKREGGTRAGERVYMYMYKVKMDIIHYADQMICHERVGKYYTSKAQYHKIPTLLFHKTAFPGIDSLGVN